MQAIQPRAHRAASIHCRVWIRKQTALYDPSAFNPLRILRWYFVIGRARCAVELGIGILRQKLFDPFFFFFFDIYNSVHESKDKSFDSFSSTIEEQTRESFYFRKIRRRCLTTGAFRKRMGMKGEKWWKGCKFSGVCGTGNKLRELEISTNFVGEPS